MTFDPGNILSLRILHKPSTSESAAAFPSQPRVALWLTRSLEALLVARPTITVLVFYGSTTSHSGLQRLRTPKVTSLQKSTEMPQIREYDLISTQKWAHTLERWRLMPDVRGQTLLIHSSLSSPSYSHFLIRKKNVCIKTYKNVRTKTRTREKKTRKQTEIHTK